MGQVNTRLMHINNFHIRIDSINVDSLQLTHKNTPKDKQDTGKRLPFFYFWLKDHYYNKSPKNFKRTTWSFGDDPKPIRENKSIQNVLKNNVPDIVGLGLYMWNKEILLDNAKWYKEQNPNCLIVAGGPSAEATTEFLKKNDVIDYVILGPGIEIFRRVMDAHMSGEEVKDLQGVSYLKEGLVQKNKSYQREHEPLNIDYITNFKNEVTDLINTYHKDYKQVILGTYFMFGCPYSCSFCEQGTALWKKVNRRPIEQIYREIDFLLEFENVQYEFLDQNFGITKEYLDIVKYLIAVNKDNKISLRNVTMAKNNVDVVFDIIELFNNSPNVSLPYKYLALQDTNSDVLIANGRPPSKEWQKIEKFKEIIKNDDKNFATREVEIMLGLIGQSYESLSVTLHDLFSQGLMSTITPNLYTVLPNTQLTSEHNKHYFKQTKVWQRNHRTSGIYYIDFDNEQQQPFHIDFLTRTSTIDPASLISFYYLYVLMSHLSVTTHWIQTPLEYLKNYHWQTDKDFIKTIAKYFSPANHHLLPDCIREDLKMLIRWFSGEDKFLMRRDNDNLGYLVHETIAKYRFQFNYEEVAGLIHDIFIEMIGKDTKGLRDIMDWQKYCTWYIGKNNLETTSYNFDDVANKKDDAFYLSNFSLKFETLDRQEVISKFRNLQQAIFIPEWSWKDVEPRLQKPLTTEELMEEKHNGMA